MEWNSVPFLAAFTVDDSWSLPSGFEIEKYPGLLNVQLVTAPATAIKPSSARQLLLSYWCSDTHCSLQSLPFTGGLGLTHLEYTGSLSDCRGPAEKWWSLTSKRDLILAAGTFVATILTIRDFGQQTYHAFLAAPDAVISTANLEPLKIQEGSQIEIPLGLQNRTKTTLDAACEGCSLKPAEPSLKSIALKISTGKIPALNTGQDPDLKLIAAGPKADKSNPAYDSYKLEGHLTAAAGWLQPNKSFFLPDREVQVWPVIAWTPLALQEVNGNFAIFRTQVFAGRKRDKAKFTVALEPAGGVRIVGVQGYNYDSLLHSDDGYSGNLVWTVDTIDAFKSDALFRINLRSVKPRAQAEWKTYESRLSLTIE